MGMRFLCLGDLHLGRRPRNLPPRLDDLGIPTSHLAPERGLEVAIEWACDQSVDAVLWSGDVVESENRYFEALTPLEQAIRRLEEHGIPSIAVAGNHDFQVLERLTRERSGFRVLGRGGRWEHVDIERDDQLVQIWGWSFPSRHFSGNPVADFP
ncbi:MAG: metallophosphoesterase, partial [Planctomycetes bacterium]|nr:metallophosphoesterase [Planctomycetota bacterium]